MEKSHLEEHIDLNHRKKNSEGAENNESVSEIKNLKRHIESVHNEEKQYECKKCDNIFAEKVELDKHVKKDHILNILGKTKQFNCEDCSFQGLNRIELKNHIRANGHKPNQIIEVCFTCEKEFDSYWSLMNHRRAEHPSNKICRYYQMDACDFNEDTCWYRHEEKKRNSKQVVDKTIECEVCEEKFKIKIV